MKSELTALALAAGLAVAGAPIAKAHEGHAHAAEVTGLTAGGVMKVGGAVLLGLALTYGLISRRGRRGEEAGRAKEEGPDK